MTNKFNIYRDYYHLPFTKIYWSKLVDLHIVQKNGMEVYECDCCHKHPLECDNKSSVLKNINNKIRRKKDYVC